MKADFVLLGCLEETRDTLNYLLQLNVKPDRIIGLSPVEAKRQGITNYVNMGAMSEAVLIPYSEVQSYSMQDKGDLQIFEGLNLRLLFVVGWQRLVPDAVLKQIKIGAIGFHGSCNLLPWGRGRSPINWSIIEGRDRFALHMFFLMPGVDDGDIIGIKIYDINPWDNCRTVYYKTAVAQAELIAGFLPSLLDGQVSTMNQPGKCFYYPKRRPEDGCIHWDGRAEEICRLVRAVTWPYPGAFTHLGNTKVMIWEAQPFSRDFFGGANPGQVCFVARNGTGEFVVRCGDGTVLVRKAEVMVEIKEGDCFH